MADKKEKEFTVVKTSVGTSIVYGEKELVLNNGLPQATLKALHAMGIKAIVKAGE